MAHTNKNADGKRTNTGTVALFPKLNTNIELLSVLTMHAVTSLLSISLIYAKSKAPLGKCTHLQVIVQQITQNTANLPLQTYGKKPVNSLYCSTRVSTLVSAIVLQTQVPLQMFPFLFIIIIPWFIPIPAMSPGLCRTLSGFASSSLMLPQLPWTSRDF